MDFKTGLILVAMAIGCAALPTQPEDDMSIFFEHVDRNAKIVGGTEAFFGSHPHMVAMTNGVLVRNFMCGGSMISQRHVLTAAHCIDSVFRAGALSENLLVVVGTNRWNQGGQSYAISRNVTHQNYVSANIKNDIGILVTSTEIQLSQLVSPIPLSYDFVGAGVPTRVAGWGRTRAHGALSEILLEINTATIDGQHCVRRAEIANFELLTPAPPVEPHIEICTYHSVGTGNCNGDSGSALVRTDTMQQVGIVSWGYPCALGAPDMYARVSAYRDWILQHTN